MKASFTVDEVREAFQTLEDHVAKQGVDADCVWSIHYAAEDVLRILAGEWETPGEAAPDEDELLQAIYRIRPLSVAGDRHQLDLFEDGQRTQAMIYIFSSRPLPDVPVALSIAPKTERQVIDFHSAAQAIHLRRQAVTEQRLAEELRTTHNQVRRWKAALTPVALGSPALPLPPPPTLVFI